MIAGDVVRIRDWPGVRGQRYEVLQVRGNTVQARDIKKGSVRVFLKANCVVDPRATKARKAREGA